MATIQNALRSGVLEAYVLPEWEHRQPIWQLFVAPELYDWADSAPELSDPKYAEGGRLLIEHLEQMFCDFRCSERPPGGDLRRMIPIKHGIWKMHPPAMRVYGWVPKPRSFVAVTGALELETKADKRLNDTKMQFVRSFIRTHGLEDTIVRGDLRIAFPKET